MRQTQAEKWSGSTVFILGGRWETTGEAEQVTAVRMRKKRGKQTSKQTNTAQDKQQQIEMSLETCNVLPVLTTFNNFFLLQNDSK